MNRSNMYSVCEVYYWAIVGAVPLLRPVGPSMLKLAAGGFTVARMVDKGGSQRTVLDDSDS